MSNLLAGMSDSLNIMAFKWRSIRPKSQKVWIGVAALFAVSVVLVTAYAGSAFRSLLTTTAEGSEEIRDSLVLWINIFLANNASLASGGILWALIASVVLIPLVGYSFTSIVPEGDLASIKVTDNHKIADSIFLQFVSSISFVQVLALTGLTSILTIASVMPGIAIVVSWMLWVLAVMTTVLAAWTFELLHRKFGLKAKLIAFLSLIVIIGLAYLAAPNDFAGLFGVGQAYSDFVQSLEITSYKEIIAVIVVFTLSLFIISSLISVVGAKTLELPERIKKKDTSKVFLARVGLSDRNKISGISSFLGNMILRQNNIWKPLLLSTAFTVGMAVIFFAFYQVLLSVSALIPIMISLVWAVNIFGILGSGTTWLVSLPQAKKKILGSIALIQYVIITIIVVIIMGLIFFIYHPDLSVFVEFMLSTAAASMVITQFALNKAVNNPYRYRVHIRGESVLPPNKAFSYMAKVFVMGFFTSGVVYGAAIIPPLLNLPIYGSISQLIVVILIGLIVRMRFVSLRRKWMYESEVLQNIIKTVGTN